VQTIPGGPSYPAHVLQHVLVQAIGEANESLTLTTPYLVPDEPVLLALRLASLRGVEVDLAIPRASDRCVADAAARGYFTALMEAGVRVHLHGPGMLHAKTIAIDRAVAAVGTANLDRRSLFLNYENVLLIFDADCVDRLRAMQAGFLSAAEPVDPRRWERRPRRVQYLQHTAKLLSPLL
jgi:cardiolipin synthase